MTILTAIDAGKGSESVISTGTELANGLDQEQVILHVVPNDNDKDRGRSAVEKVMQDTFEEEELPTIKIVSEASIWEKDASSDRVADQIIDEAENADVNYVVLGSRKRSPSGKAILGSIAQLVLIDTSTPVVIVEEIG